MQNQFPDFALSAQRAPTDAAALFSLDKSVFPKRNMVLEGLLACVLAPVGVAVSSVVLSQAITVGLPILRAIARILAFLLESMGRMGQAVSSYQPTLPDISADSAAGPLRSAADSLMQGVSSLFSSADGSESTALDEWQSGKLVSRDRLSNEYIKYKFQLPNHAQQIALAPGQELLLCAADLEDAVLKEPFFPVSPRRAKGYFEVIAKSDKQSVSLMNSLAIGDEIALKAGKDRLSSKAPGEHIDHVQIIASGEGIAPTLQVLQAVLQPRDSSVKSTDVVWVNEHQHEFVLAKELEAVAKRYAKKVRVTPIIDSDLYGHDVTNNPTMKQALKPFTAGSMAVVCGPDYVVDRVSKYLAAVQGYPQDHIASIKF